MWPSMVTIARKFMGFVVCGVYCVWKALARQQLSAVFLSLSLSVWLYVGDVLKGSCCS